MSIATSQKIYNARTHVVAQVKLGELCDSGLMAQRPGIRA